jgi:hypothetical protein
VNYGTEKKLQQFAAVSFLAAPLLHPLHQRRPISWEGRTYASLAVFEMIARALAILAGSLLAFAGAENTVEYSYNDNAGSGMEDAGSRSSRELAGLGSVFEITMESFQTINAELADVTIILSDVQGAEGNYNLRAAYLNTAKDVAAKSKNTVFAFVDVGTDEGKSIMGAYEQKEGGEQIFYPSLLAIVPRQYPVQIPLSEKVLKDPTGADLQKDLYWLLLPPVTLAQKASHMYQIRRNMNNDSYLCRFSAGNEAQAKMLSQAASKIKRQTIAAPLPFVDETAIDRVPGGRAVIEFFEASPDRDPADSGPVLPQWSAEYEGDLTDEYEFMQWVQPFTLPVVSELVGGTSVVEKEAQRMLLQRIKSTSCALMLLFCDFDTPEGQKRVASIRRSLSRTADALRGKINVLLVSAEKHQKQMKKYGLAYNQHLLTSPSSTLPNAVIVKSFSDDRVFYRRSSVGGGGAGGSAAGGDEDEKVVWEGEDEDEDEDEYTAGEGHITGIRYSPYSIPLTIHYSPYSIPLAIRYSPYGTRHTSHPTPPLPLHPSILLPPHPPPIHPSPPITPTLPLLPHRTHPSSHRGGGGNVCERVC